MSYTSFRKTVWDFYRKEGRHDLPWRKTRDPYKILVSEVMLQQTQVERVRDYYRAFLEEFGAAESLASAPLSRVLKLWQGLGYNRRAKMLHQAAKAIVREYGGKFPKSMEELEELPGVGPYTARAVAAFAYNADVIFIETNIRTAVIHHFYPRKKKVRDAEIEKILMKVFPKGKAREWYAALMDYGASLKKTGVRTNARVKGYAKQSAFRGSFREARGAVLKALARGPKRTSALTPILGDDREEQVKAALASLTKEEMITLARGMFRLAD